MIAFVRWGSIVFNHAPHNDFKPFVKLHFYFNNFKFVYFFVLFAFGVRTFYDTTHEALLKRTGPYGGGWHNDIDFKL